jgi:hypothetical protein
MGNWEKVVQKANSRYAESYVVTASSIELAWAAGFYEGEGSITFRGSRYRTVQLDISQKDLWPLQRWQNIFHAGTIQGRTRKNGFHVYEWHLSNQDEVLTIALALRPYLSPRRQEQIEKVVRDWFTRPRSREWNTTTRTKAKVVTLLQEAL